MEILSYPPARYFHRWKYDPYWDFNVYLLTLLVCDITRGGGGVREEVWSPIYLRGKVIFFDRVIWMQTFPNVYRDNTAYFTECRNPLMNIYSAAREFTFQDTLGRGGRSPLASVTRSTRLARWHRRFDATFDYGEWNAFRE